MVDNQLFTALRKKYSQHLLNSSLKNEAHFVLYADQGHLLPVECHYKLDTTTDDGGVLVELMLPLAKSVLSARDYEFLNDINCFLKDDNVHVVFKNSSLVLVVKFPDPTLGETSVSNALIEHMWNCAQTHIEELCTIDLLFHRLGQTSVGNDLLLKMIYCDESGVYQH